MPQDKLLSKILLNTSSKDPMPRAMKHSGIGSMGLSRLQRNFIYSDIFSFDNRDYKNGLEFEDINYQAEYAWNTKNQKFTIMPVRKMKYNTIKLNTDFENIQQQIPFHSKKAFENQKIYNAILDRAYFQNHSSFYNFRQLIDENFKVDFLSYNKYEFISPTEPIFKRKKIKQIELENEIKQKYYTNYIYKSLLHFEIDNLISHQRIPLLEFEENELFKRRISLSNYYESNYYYSKLSHFEYFRKLFYNSKSYSNNIYNQQFKGTLRIIEKIFPITLNQKDKPYKRSILKYDNPEFISSKIASNIFYHEELHKFNANYVPNYKNSITTSISPFYIAWNENLNQLVITNNIFIPIQKNEKLYLRSEKSFYNKYILNSLTMPNIKKLNNLIRNSYAIIRYPLLKNGLISDIENTNSLLDYSNIENVNLEHFFYVRLTTLLKPQKGGFNWLNSFNWFSLRYKKYWNLVEK